MKKLLLVLVGIAMTAGSIMAQDYEKNIYGVRAGLNLPNISMGGFVSTKAGFHVSGVYQRLLTKSIPLYLETGLSFSEKGYKFYNEYNVTSMYLQMPVMVNYKFNIKDIVTLYPSVGLYYGIGIGGKYKFDDEDMFDYDEDMFDYDDEYEDTKPNTFGSDGFLKRSDFGMRFCATAEWNRISFGLGYELGFINVVEDFVMNGMPRNFFISIGYNF